MGVAQGQSGLINPTIFLDENHSGNPWLHAAQNHAGVQYVRHLSIFAPGVEDTVWIPQVAAKQWVVLTSDARIRTNFLERQAVRQHGLRLFYFTRNDIGGADMGVALTRALPKMMALCMKQTPPFAASISRSGDVALRDTFDGRSYK